MEVLTGELIFDTKTRQLVQAQGETKAQRFIRQAPTGDLADFTTSGGLEHTSDNFGAYEGVLGAYEARNIRLLNMGTTKSFGPNQKKGENVEENY